jgi:acyl carrier protein
MTKKKGDDPLFAKVKDILVTTLCVDDAEITTDTNLETDLGADSLDAVEVGMKLEESFDFDINEEKFEKVKTVAELVDFVKESTSPNGRAAKREEPLPEDV